MRATPGSRPKPSRFAIASEGRGQGLAKAGAAMLTETDRNRLNDAEALSAMVIAVDDFDVRDLESHAKSKTFT
jgi:hypothetical protein